MLLHPACSRRKNNPSRALQDAERCVEVNPSWAKGYSRIGTALFRLDKHAQAAEAYSKGGERGGRGRLQTSAERILV